MRSTIDEVITHSKQVALGKEYPAGDTAKTVEVKDQVPCPHDQFSGGDSQLTTATTLDTE